MARTSTTDIVLLGAGHAHVEVLRRLARDKRYGMRLTLITCEIPSSYSGMLPGLIRGEYGFAQAHIDCARLAHATGTRLVVAKADAIDFAAGHVRTGVAPVAFDLLSIDVGGTPPMPHGGGIGVKPVGRLLAQLDTLADPLAVVGGGAGGAELALALAARGRRGITLLGRDTELLPGVPAAVRRIVRDRLAVAGIAVRCGVAATGYTDGALHLADGSIVPAGAALWATGVVAPAFLAESGLACDLAGCVRVDRSLRSVSHDRVFAAGDCAAVADLAVPKSGVWAVRAGPVLAENLRRAALGKVPRPWQPQRDALAILGLGDGRAVAWRNGVTVSGRLVWRWKDWIDRRWMLRYQAAT